MSLVELPRDMSHAAVRRRLLNPPNAVRDRGIDLKRKRRVEPPPPPPPPPQFSVQVPVFPMMVAVALQAVSTLLMTVM